MKIARMMGSLLVLLILCLNISEDIVSKLSNEVTNFIFHNDYEIKEQDKLFLLLGPGIGEIKDIGYNNLLRFLVRSFFRFFGEIKKREDVMPIFAPIPRPDNKNGPSRSYVIVLVGHEFCDFIRQLGCSIFGDTRAQI